MSRNKTSIPPLLMKGSETLSWMASIKDDTARQKVWKSTCWIITRFQSQWKESTNLLLMYTTYVQKYFFLHPAEKTSGSEMREEILDLVNKLERKYDLLDAGLTKSWFPYRKSGTKAIWNNAIVYKIKQLLENSSPPKKRAKLSKARAGNHAPVIQPSNSPHQLTITGYIHADTSPVVLPINSPIASPTTSPSSHSQEVVVATQPMIIDEVELKSLTTDEPLPLEPVKITEDEAIANVLSSFTLEQFNDVLENPPAEVNMTTYRQAGVFVIQHVMAKNFDGLTKQLNVVKNVNLYTEALDYVIKCLHNAYISGKLVNGRINRNDYPKLHINERKFNEFQRIIRFGIMIDTILTEGFGWNQDSHEAEMKAGTYLIVQHINRELQSNKGFSTSFYNSLLHHLTRQFGKNSKYPFKASEVRDVWDPVGPKVPGTIIWNMLNRQHKDAVKFIESQAENSDFSFV